MGGKEKKGQVCGYSVPVIAQAVQGFASLHKERVAVGAKIRILFDLVKT